MGGMLFGLSREVATEFSFFLAIPVMFAATGYEMVKNRALLSAGDLQSIAVGFVVSFVFALIAVKALIRYVAQPRLPRVRVVPPGARGRRARVLPGLAGLHFPVGTVTVVRAAPSCRPARSSP